MKKILFLSFFMFAFWGLKAQNYYPTGSTFVPTWHYVNVVGENEGNYHNPKTDKNGCAVSDAGLTYTTFKDGDAYDGAFEFFVNIGDSVYTETGIDSVPSFVDTVGTSISLGEQLIDGFYVSKSYFFSPNTPVVRAVFKIRNPTSAPMSAKIGIYTNMGSDDATTLDTCSTGADTLNNAARWMVTWDTNINGSGFPSGDPINTFVRFGPGTIASTPVFGEMPQQQPIPLGYYQDDYLDTVAVTVPANSYSLIMQFNRMDTTLQAARANAVDFNSVDTINARGFLSGMSEMELSKVVNWNFSSLYCTTTINPNPQTICQNSSYSINGHTYTEAGIYNDTLKTAAGCDSVIVTTIIVNTLDITTSVNLGTITANQNGATYQWLDCDNAMAVIPGGAANQSFTPTESGDYAVSVTFNSCTDTSACQAIIVDGIQPINQSAQIKVYPNPSTGLFTVSAKDVKDIKVYNPIGEMVYQNSNGSLNTTVDISKQLPGLYILQITTDSGIVRQRIVKK
jgi:hypothetical protein